MGGRVRGDESGKKGGVEGVITLCSVVAAVARVYRRSLDLQRSAPHLHTKIHKDV